MLKQSKRLKGRLTVQKVLKDGEKTVCPLFTVFRLENQFGVDRYAVIISKKSEKLAVKRNKARRRTYEAIRLIEKENARQNTKFYDRVLLVRSACRTASLETQKSTLKQKL